MGYRVIHSPLAKLEIAGIGNNIANTLHNPAAAVDLLEQYLKKMSILEENPLLYPLARNAALAKKKYRSFSFGKYIGLYTVSATKQEVLVVRVFHQRQDYENLI